MQLHSHCIVFRCQSHKKMYGKKTEHVQSYGCKTDNELIINKTFTNGVTQIPWKTSKDVVPKKLEFPRKHGETKLYVINGIIKQLLRFIH